jgi:endonuclease/exonuclease/phosphatase family metal-dependent hydrolase
MGGLAGRLVGGVLADHRAGRCVRGRVPAHFRADYLPAGATAHCIDFILTAGEVTAESAELVFAEKQPLGYVSDHIGLRARLSLTASTPGRGRFARP